MIASYRFSPYSCGTTGDSTGNGLLGNFAGAALDCSGSDGVTSASSTSTPITSANTIVGLRNALTNDEFSMEFWLTQASMSNLILMSIEDAVPVRNLMGCEYSMRLIRSTDTGKIKLRTCSDVMIVTTDMDTAAVTGDLTHLVLTVKHTAGYLYYVIYVNGAMAKNNAPRADSAWGGGAIGCQEGWQATSRLKLMGSDGTKSESAGKAWNGRLYSFSVLSSAIPIAEVSSRYAAGLSSIAPTLAPSEVPTVIPTASPTAAPSAAPSPAPSEVPTVIPTASPTAAPSPAPSEVPTVIPTASPTAAPLAAPSAAPSPAPSEVPTVIPTASPTAAPSVAPSFAHALTGSMYDGDILSRFEFTRESCIARSFPDLTKSSLLGSVSGDALTCSGGTGVSMNSAAVISSGVPPLVSAANLDMLRGALEQGFSIELWLRAVPGQTSDKKLLSVEENLVSADSLSCEHSLALLHGFNGKRLLLSLCRPGCSAYLIADTPMLQPTHVVVTEKQGLYRLYVDGVMRQEASPNCQGTGIGSADWADHSRLRLLGGVMNPEAGWEGTIYSLTFHRNAMTTAQVEQRRTTSFPNSQPRAYPKQLTVRENGEDGDHSLQPEFYDRPIDADQLVALVLQVSDEDDNALSPLYDAELGARTQLELTSLPDKGSSLYYLDGTAITVAPTRVPRSGDGSFAVRFRPPPDVHSAGAEPLCSFTFRAIDGLDASLLSADAVISVIVTATNKPPVPIRNTSSHHAVTNIVTVLPAFDGVDQDGQVVRAGVATLPASGLLYDVTLNDIVIPTPIVLPRDGSPYLLQGFRVAYVNNGPQAGNMDERGVFGADEFSFVVVDDKGVSSRRERCTLDLFTALRAIAAPSSATSPVAAQNQYSLLTLGGVDTSGLGRNLYIRVLRFPSNGSLFSAYPRELSYVVGEMLLPTTPVASGSIVLDHSYGYQRGAPMYYRGSVFSVPMQTADWPSAVISAAVADTFEYEVFSSDGSCSLPVTQRIEVRNVNQPTELSFALDLIAWPLGHVQVHAVGLAPVDGVTNSARISGFRLPDPDLATDLIRVRVESQQGAKMSLVANSLMHLMFVGSKCRGKRWQCKGSGDTESVMDFLATPHRAQEALNGLAYRSTRENIWDNITVTVFDGAGGGCLDDSQGSLSLRLGPVQCYVRSVQLPVEVLSYVAPPQDAPPDFKMSTFAFLKDSTGLLVTIALMVLLCCICVRACRWVNTAVKEKLGCVKAPPVSLDALEKGSSQGKDKCKSGGSGERRRRHRNGNKGMKADAAGIQIQIRGKESGVDMKMKMNTGNESASASTITGTSTATTVSTSDMDSDSSGHSSTYSADGGDINDGAGSRHDSHSGARLIICDTGTGRSSAPQAVGPVFSMSPLDGTGVRSESLRQSADTLERLNMPPSKLCGAETNPAFCILHDLGGVAFKTRPPNPLPRPAPPPPRQRNSDGVCAALAYNSAKAMRRHAGEEYAQVDIALESVYLPPEENFLFSVDSAPDQQNQQLLLLPRPVFSPSGLAPTFAPRVTIHATSPPPGPAPSPCFTVSSDTGGAILCGAELGSSPLMEAGDVRQGVFNLNKMADATCSMGVVGLSVRSAPVEDSSAEEENEDENENENETETEEVVVPNPLDATALRRAHRAAAQWRRGRDKGGRGRGRGRSEVGSASWLAVPSFTCPGLGLGGNAKSTLEKAEAWL